jgi:hypothetical protein
MHRPGRRVLRDRERRLDSTAAFKTAIVRRSMVKLIALVLPLGLDTQGDSRALGMVGLPPRQRPRISLLFTVFEGRMPLIGLALGAPVGRAIGTGADYVAIAALVGFGLYTLLGREPTRRRGSRTSPRAACWPRSCSGSASASTSSRSASRSVSCGSPWCR